MGNNIASLFQMPPKAKPVQNLEKDRSLNGKARVKARKRERRERASRENPAL